MELVLASHNNGKAREIESLVTGFVSVKTISSYGLKDEIPETGSTLKENALIKARYCYSRLGKDTIADDSGLEVFALDGAPGVYSARYAGTPKNDKSNIEKLLRELAGKTNRSAQFRTVIALIYDGNEHIFEGTVKGTISTVEKGSAGFGYDPVFIPEGSNKTFAEMTADEKNRVSHRAIAIRKLVDFLITLRK